jgi:NADPH:quinone reductase-like Zn-dependent oxidoreductase
LKALIYNSFGSPDVLEWEADWDTPQIDSNQVLVRVAAGSINPKDVLLRKGKFSRTLARDPLPRVSGLDISGEVVETGENITGFKPGDVVFGMTNRFFGGVHSEYAVFGDNEIALAPSNISVVNASSIPLAALTALQALRDHGRVAPGHRVLINGASGGVGHFAIQIAKILGAEVHAVCGPSHLEFAASLGADFVYDYKIEKAPKIAADFHSVFDVFGRFSRRDFSRQLGRNGIFVSTVPKMTTISGEIFARVGLYKRSRLVMVKSCTSDLNRLCEWVESNRLRPHVERVYPVTAAQDAHRHIESRHTTGKVVLSFSPPKKRNG